MVNMIIGFAFGFIIGGLVLVLQNSENEKKLESQIDELKNKLEEREMEIDHLRNELEESRAREGKGALEIMIDSIADAVAGIGKMFSTMSPDELKALVETNDDEEDDTDNEDI